MKLFVRPILTATFLVMAFPAISQAAVLVGYDFTGGTAGTLTPVSALDPSSAPPTNVTATAISIGAGLGTSTFQDNGGNIELNMLTNSSSATTVAGAVSSNQYIEFTLNTPSASFALDLDTLTLDLRRGGASNSRFIFLRTSLDAFASNISPGTVLSLADTTPTTFTFDNTPTYNNVTGPVTFRLFTYTSGGGNNSVRVDNIVVNGSVIPEPSSFALLAGACALLTVMRRRRRMA